MAIWSRNGGQKKKKPEYCGAVAHCIHWAGGESSTIAAEKRGKNKRVFVAPVKKTTQKQAVGKKGEEAPIRNKKATKPEGAFQEWWNGGNSQIST